MKRELKEEVILALLIERKQIIPDKVKTAVKGVATSKSPVRAAVAAVTAMKGPKKRPKAAIKFKTDAGKAEKVTLDPKNAGKNQRRRALGNAAGRSLKDMAANAATVAQTPGVSPIAIGAGILAAGAVGTGRRYKKSLGQIQTADKATADLRAGKRVKRVQGDANDFSTLKRREGPTVRQPKTAEFEAKRQKFRDKFKDVGPGHLPNRLSDLSPAANFEKPKTPLQMRIRRRSP